MRLILFFIALLPSAYGCGAGATLARGAAHLDGDALRLAAAGCDIDAFTPLMSPETRRLVEHNQALMARAEASTTAVRSALLQRFGEKAELDDRGQLSFRGPDGQVMKRGLGLGGGMTSNQSDCLVVQRFAKALSSEDVAQACTGGMGEQATLDYRLVGGTCRLVPHEASNLWVASQALQHTAEISELIRDMVVERLRVDTGSSFDVWAATAIEELTTALRIRIEEMVTHMNFLFEAEAVRRGLNRNRPPPNFIFGSKEVEFVLEGLSSKLLANQLGDEPIAPVYRWGVQIRDPLGRLIGGAQTVDMLRILLFAARYYEGIERNKNAWNIYVSSKYLLRELEGEHPHLRASLALGLLATSERRGHADAQHIVRLKALRTVFEGLEETTDWTKARVSLALARSYLALGALDDAQVEMERAIGEADRAGTLIDFRARPFLTSQLKIQTSRGESTLDSQRAFYANLEEGGDIDRKRAIDVGVELARALAAKENTKEAKKVAAALADSFEWIEDVPPLHRRDLGAAYISRAQRISELHATLEEWEVSERFGQMAFDRLPWRAMSLDRSDWLAITEHLVRVQAARGRFAAAVATAMTHLERAGGSPSKPKVNRAAQPIEVGPALCLLSRALEAEGKRAGRSRAKALRKEALGYLSAVPEGQAEEAESLVKGLCASQTDG